MSVKVVHLCALVALLAAFAGSAIAQPVCPQGQGRLRDGEPCIPVHLLNYLYCLSHSGGGKIEIVKKEERSHSDELEISIGGKGSGVIISVEGAGGIKREEASRALKELSEKLDPSLAKNCKDLAVVPQQSPTPDVSMIFPQLAGRWVSNMSRPTSNVWNCRTDRSLQFALTFESFDVGSRTFHGTFYNSDVCPGSPQWPSEQSGKVIYEIVRRDPLQLLARFVTTTCIKDGAECSAGAFGTDPVPVTVYVDGGLLKYGNNMRVYHRQ